ncbi:hypothetical protein DW958_17485, partial [Ruminococcus sp. AM46-18]
PWQSQTCAGIYMFFQSQTCAGIYMFFVIHIPDLFLIITILCKIIPMRMLNPCKISSHPIHSMQSSHKSIRIVNIKIKRTIARDMTLTGVHLLQ